MIRGFGAGPKVAIDTQIVGLLYKNRHKNGAPIYGSSKLPIPGPPNCPTQWTLYCPYFFVRGILGYYIFWHFWRSRYMDFGRGHPPVAPGVAEAPSASAPHGRELCQPAPRKAKLRSMGFQENLGRLEQILLFGLFKGGFKFQFRYCGWYRSGHGTDFDISEVASV